MWALGKFPDVELTPDEALEIVRALTLCAVAMKQSGHLNSR